MLDELHSDVHHDGIKSPQVTFDGESSLFVDTNVFHRHVFSRGPDLVESAPPVILAVISHLRTHVSAVDTLERLPGL